MNHTDEPQWLIDNYSIANFSNRTLPSSWLTFLLLFQPHSSTFGALVNRFATMIESGEHTKDAANESVMSNS